jgi:hypothetical protein
MKGRKKYVWIVVVGEDYEGYTIDSVHTSKCRAVKRLQELYDEDGDWRWIMGNELPSLSRACNYVEIEKHEIK